MDHRAVTHLLQAIRRKEVTRPPEHIRHRWAAVLWRARNLARPALTFAHWCRTHLREARAPAQDMAGNRSGARRTDGGAHVAAAVSVTRHWPGSKTMR